MEKFLLKTKNRISDYNNSYSVHHCYNREKYNVPIANVLKNLVSIKDCKIEPSMGIFPHKHENIELITVLITGTLVQKNNLGETFELNPGDIQLMNAGSGVSHFEYNKSENTILNCIQFSLASKNKHQNHPKSELMRLNTKKTGLQKIIAPKNKLDKYLEDKEDVFLYYGYLETNTQEKYSIKNKESGILILNISGSTEINGEVLENRDTLILRNISEITITSKKLATFFLIEI